MGVPSFYRWLVNKYPNVVQNAVEDKGLDVNITFPNPNGYEFDHLYLDMNGIIHPCFHPDNQLFPPTTAVEVFENMYQYIDHLVKIVRPRKLLYLAIDGVAPRAKLNQQRSRRFKTAKDNQIVEEEEKRLREEFERKGKSVLPKLESEISDSNVITPGTEFMSDVSNALKSYIFEKLNDDPGWRDIKVVLSDAGVPGEGEHKIMSFIRSLRSLPGYDPNTRHCLYGLDADLIMLALATHELHFSILREDVLTVQEQMPISETALLSSIKKAEEKPSGTSEHKPFFDIRDKKTSLLHKQRYQFLHVWILREYLELDMQITELPDKFVYDIERIIDDFVFICFFAGNDFLPHMPTVAIHENGIDLLIHVYKKELKNLGGYLVDMSRVNDKNAAYIKLKRVEKFILSVGSFEEQIFKKRSDIRERKLRRILSELSESNEDELNDGVSEVNITDVPYQQSTNTMENETTSDPKQMLENTKELKEKLKNCIRNKSDTFKDGNLGSDKIKLGSVGWKNRYYKEKFSVEDPKEVEVLKKQIVEKYTEGLCWVLLYYYSGIPSWNWYYPYHYGPFASDLKGLAQLKVRFSKGSPFTPFDQLMAVLPQRSAHALPKPYQDLMLDRNSSIIDFYPDDVEIDVEGKRYHWQGICKLPFIEQEALVNATRKLKDEIEVNEEKRNTESNDELFMRSSNSEGETWCCLWQHRVNREKPPAKAQDGILSFNYELPVTTLHVPRLLQGVQAPEKIIFENDIMKTCLWHEYGGSRPTSRVPAQDRYRGASNIVMNDNTTHKYTGHVRGFDSMGRGKGISSNVQVPVYYKEVNQSHRYPIGYQQSSSAVRSYQVSGQRLSSPVSTSDANDRSGMQNSFCPSTVGVVSSESYSWRSSASAISSSSHGNNTDFRGRGHFSQGNTTQFRGRGHFSQGNTTQFRGRGHFSQGNTTEFRGRGHFSQGNTTQFRGTGQFSQGNTTQFRGRGHFSEGNTTQFRGRGQFSEGNTTQFRGRGHFRPNMNAGRYSSQYPDNRDPNRC